MKYIIFDQYLNDFYIYDSLEEASQELREIIKSERSMGREKPQEEIFLYAPKKPEGINYCAYCGQEIREGKEE